MAHEQPHSWSERCTGWRPSVNHVQPADQLSPSQGSAGQSAATNLEATGCMEAQMGTCCGSRAVLRTVRAICRASVLHMPACNQGWACMVAPSCRSEAPVSVSGGRPVLVGKRNEGDGRLRLRQRQVAAPSPVRGRRKRFRGRC